MPPADVQLFGTQRINDAGHLEVGGADTVDLAREFDTPLYVMDEEAMRQCCRDYVSAFRGQDQGSIVSFASKSFLCRRAAQLVHEEGLHLDVASAGELEVVRAAGIDAGDVTFHGNFKKDEDLLAGLDAGVGLFAIDSFDELHRLSELAASRGRKQRALIRLAPGIDGHTLDAISTGRNDTKFGITVENGAAARAAKEAIGLSGIKLAGFHAHIGSQILEMEPFEVLAGKLVEFCAGVRAETSWSPEILVLGGGLGIRYTADDQPRPIAELAESIVTSVRAAANRYSLPVPRVGVEPGRSIAGEAGLTLYTVGPVKEVPCDTDTDTTRIYAAVDGGLSDNPRPIMYGSRYPVLLANRAGEARVTTVRVAGRHCETDTLFDVSLPTPRRGDLMAVLCTGAYNHVMASNYNYFSRPAVVFVRDGKADLVVRRETMEDLMRRDVG